MRFTPSNCPECGEPASGTMDTIPGLALLRFEADGTAAWQGETKVLWNGQTTDRDEEGKVTLACEAGHAWQAEMEPDLDDAPPVRDRGL